MLGDDYPVVLQRPMRHLVTVLFFGCLLLSTVAGQEVNPPSQALPTVTSFDCPEYPPVAKKARLQGLVRIEVSTDGQQVSGTKLISGHPMIAPAAIANVRTWKFAPHTPETFTVTYLYVFQGKFKPDPVTKCRAKIELPTQVTVSIPMP